MSFGSQFLFRAYNYKLWNFFIKEIINLESETVEFV